MDQLIFASLSHIHYWYEVGMLKVPYRSSNTFPHNKYPIYQGNSRCHTDPPVSACCRCHFSYNAPSPGCYTQPPTGHRSQRSHQVPLPLVTRPLIKAGGYLGLITSPHEVRRSISRANHKSPHGLRPYVLTRSHRSIFRAYHKSPHQVTSEYISG